MVEELNYIFPVLDTAEEDQKLTEWLALHCRPSQGDDSELSDRSGALDEEGDASGMTKRPSHHVLSILIPKAVASDSSSDCEIIYEQAGSNNTGLQETEKVSWNGRTNAPERRDYVQECCHRYPPVVANVGHGFSVVNMIRSSRGHIINNPPNPQSMYPYLSHLDPPPPSVNGSSLGIKMLDPRQSQPLQGQPSVLNGQTSYLVILFNATLAGY
ncbi:hypothetical protein SISNIDRAFT_471288 [Sistotremastrum niveocremeum HHB9708]|uniref:Uncharacterized protein n=1 Tax=Sistotremastrum niveocremeum HHB9708 TaxID=1314777 RepID=A0A164MUU8_9AGAM|nr:hypothetical protein SISNIDRAFT_471288 [Sistotremastrum niveocremeum HHB9708]